MKATKTASQCPKMAVSSEGFNTANFNSRDKEAKGSGSDAEGSISQSSYNSSESNDEILVHATSPAKETEKGASRKKIRQVPPTTLSHPLTLTTSSLKQNGSVSDTRMPGFWTSTLVCGTIT